jgi:hypothetical protein
MIFLMNDQVLDVDMRQLAPPLAAGRFRALSLPFVMTLGRELFAERPLVHRDEPERAKRLAALIVCKAPQVNAARFQAPRAGCRPDEVETQLAEVGLEVLASLQVRQDAAALTPVIADSEVWRRMAA